MNKETKEELLLNAARWCNNILVELLSNYGSSVNSDAMERLRDAVTALGEFDAAIRFPKLQELSDETQKQGWYDKDIDNPLRKQK